MVGEFVLADQHALVVNDEYALHMDEYKRGQEDASLPADQVLLLHLRFTKWTPSVLKRFNAHWHSLRRCVTAPLFVIGEVDDDKWQRFVTRFGFTPFDTVKCANGESRRLFIHVSSTPEHPHVLLRQQKDRQQVGSEPRYDRSVGTAGRRAH